MALAAQTSQELISFFDGEVKHKTIQIYQAIPGTLIKFLDKRGIVKKIKFNQDFAAVQVPMGNKKQVNFIDFEEALRKTIQDSFINDGVTEIRAEDISHEITAQYQVANPSRASAGASVSAIIKFNKTFQKKEGEYWTSVNAYVYIHIEEKCEDNWFHEDKRKFNYSLTIELNGVAINKEKAMKFSELIVRTPVTEAIKNLEKQCCLTWDDM